MSTGAELQTRPAPGRLGAVAVIGAGRHAVNWAVRFLCRGADVRIWDPEPGCLDDVETRAEVAMRSVLRLGSFPRAREALLTGVGTLEEACTGVEFVQVALEAGDGARCAIVPRIDALLADDVPIGVCCGGVPEAARGRAGRLVGVRALEPIHIVAAMELSPGSADDAVVARACEIYRDIGMSILTHDSCSGWATDRLMETLGREAAELCRTDGLRAADLDMHIASGPALLWAVAGVNPAATEKDNDEDLDCTARDDAIVAVTQALRSANLGAGRLLEDDEARRYASIETRRWHAGDAVDGPLELYACRVRPDWLDYNGHMTTVAYHIAFDEAFEQFLRYIGCDDSYRATGRTVFVADNRVRYLCECRLGMPLGIRTQLLGLDRKRLHVLQTMVLEESGELASTNESLWLHVDMQQQRVMPFDDRLLTPLNAIMASHAALTKPEGIGAAMGVRP